MIDNNLRRTTTSLQWHKDTVIKHQDPELRRIEYTKSQLGADIGLRTGFFCAPKILEHDPIEGSITFERMRNYQQLSKILADGKVPEPLMVRLGRALAEIHGNLNLPQEITTPIVNLGVELHAPSVFVHGDFSGNNILYNEKDDKIVIVDWATAPWLEGGGTWGPRYVDLGVMIMTLFIRRVFAQGPAQDSVPLAHAFLDGYCFEGRSGFVSEDLKLYFPKLLALSIGWRRNIGVRARLRVLASLPTVGKVNKFVSSL